MSVVLCTPSCLNQVRVRVLALVHYAIHLWATTDEGPRLGWNAWSSCDTDSCSLIILASDVFNLKSFIIENKFS